MFLSTIYTKNVRLVSFNLESRGILDNLIRPNIYRTRLTSKREHKSLVLGLIISSKVSSFRDSKFLAECFIIYVCYLSIVLCHRQIFVFVLLIICLFVIVMTDHLKNINFDYIFIYCVHDSVFMG